jgi:hypothetical protein
MTVLVAAVVLVGVLGAVNLLFCLGVIRRLREHTEILDSIGDGHGGGRDLILPAGETAAEFAAVSLGGRPVSRASLAGPTLVAFFSPGCAPCTEQLPHFVDLARTHSPEQVLAVVCGPGDAAPLVGPLSEVAEVVREEATGPVQEAFAIRGYPSFAVVEPGGLVRQSAQRVDGLPALSPA